MMFVCCGCIGDRVETTKYVNNYPFTIVALEYVSSKECFSLPKGGVQYESRLPESVDDSYKITNLQGKVIHKVHPADAKKCTDGSADWIVEIGP